MPQQSLLPVKPLGGFLLWNICPVHSILPCALTTHWFVNYRPQFLITEQSGAEG